MRSWYVYDSGNYEIDDFMPVWDGSKNCRVKSRKTGMITGGRVMEVMELLTQAVEQNAADIFLVPGMPFHIRSVGGSSARARKDHAGPAGPDDHKNL